MAIEQSPDGIKQIWVDASKHAELKRIAQHDQTSMKIVMGRLIGEETDRIASETSGVPRSCRGIPSNLIKNTLDDEMDG